jgi:hypothetical protein
MIKTMMEAKKATRKNCKVMVNALTIICTNAKITLETKKHFTSLEVKAKCTWKKIKAEGTKRWGQPMHMHQGLRLRRWTCGEDSVLVAFKSPLETMQEKDTEVGKSANTFAQAVEMSLDNLDAVTFQWCRDHDTMEI